MPTALEGMRVLDLTHYIAGPFCTKLLADYGADVVKIERRGTGDPARALGPFMGDEPGIERSGLFLHLNTNKQSVAVDLKTEAGRQVVLDLARDADVLVESFRPGVMARLGLDYDTLAAINPRLVMTSISNYGQTGPYRDYKMTEIVLYAMGGTMQATGMPDREPVKLALTVEQFFCGGVAASATMGAHIGSLVDGEGQHLDLALFEMQVGNQDRGVQAHTTYQYNGNVPARTGGDSGRSIVPTGVYPTSDGYVQFFTLQPLIGWARICELMGHPELAHDPHFTAPENFYQNPERKQEVDGLLFEWLLQHTKQEVMEATQAIGYPCGAINTMADVFADPNLAAHNFFRTVDHPVVGRLRHPGAPFMTDVTPWRAGRAPLLGEHTDQVLRGIGYPDGRIAELRAEGVIG